MVKYHYSSNTSELLVYYQLTPFLRNSGRVKENRTMFLEAPTTDMPADGSTAPQPHTDGDVATEHTDEEQQAA